jgi:hypothetical protein
MFPTDFGKDSANHGSAATDQQLDDGAVSSLMCKDAIDKNPTIGQFHDRGNQIPKLGRYAQAARCGAVEGVLSEAGSSRGTFSALKA